MEQKSLIKIFSVIIIVTILGSFLLSKNTYTSTSATSIDEAAGFTYNNNYPDNQVDTNLGYYKLKMTPKQSQVISLDLHNPTNKALTVGVRLNDSKTNQNGLLNMVIPP